MSGSPEVLTLGTAQGPARAHLYHPRTGAEGGAVLLGHGAGGGIGAADLQALTTLTQVGWTVVLVEQPWRVAGRRVAVPAPRLDAAWRELVPALLRERPGLAGPLVVGGRSAGARVACRTAPGDSVAGLPRAVGVLCLAFPLHPPGRPDRSRAAELAVPPAHGMPTLVLQGDRDPFGTPEEVQAAVPSGGTDLVTVVAVPGTHTPTRVGTAQLCDAATAWVDGLP